jgi:hypothetical protein
MARNRSPLKREVFTLKDAVRKCGHKEDYSCSFEHRLNDYAASSLCTSCKRSEEAAKEERRNAREAIALKWVKDHGITIMPIIDASDAYFGDVELRFYIKTGLK